MPTKKGKPDHATPVAELRKRAPELAPLLDAMERLQARVTALESSSDGSRVTLGQDVMEAHRATDHAHPHGLCTDKDCGPCHYSKQAIAQQTYQAGRNSLVRDLHEAAQWGGVEDAADAVVDAWERWVEAGRPEHEAGAEREQDPLTSLVG